MALPILDGNQTATTLSTVLTSGEHIPAHTVVSLGSVAISNITSAVSGSVVSVSNFPSTQTIAGTVTANVPALSIDTGFGGSVLYPVSGVDVNAIRAVLYSGPDFSSDTGAPVDGTNPLYVQGTVGVQGTVTVGNTVAISGTVTANLPSTTVTVSSFPRPTWTDYSGSIVTAGTAVTAISTTTRSYLLAQVTTGQMFLNIGATCTTGNGVYFSAGQGFAWETSVPQGIVSIISSVTGTGYVLKDG